MNAQSTSSRFQSTTRGPIRSTAVADFPRPPHRERDFGVGYGSSSGYASPRRYVSNTPQRLFRCA